VAALAATSAGCADPLIGHWEADNSKVDLDIEASTDADYEGTGSIYLCPEDSRDNCRLCTIKFEITDKGGGAYEFEGAFAGKCDVFGEFDDFECDLVEGDLECELPGDVEVEYERKEQGSEDEDEG
jgi:hypothetical protein